MKITKLIENTWSQRWEVYIEGVTTNQRLALKRHPAVDYSAQVNENTVIAVLDVGYERDYGAERCAWWIAEDVGVSGSGAGEVWRLDMQWTKAIDDALKLGKRGSRRGQGAA